MRQPIHISHQRRQYQVLFRRRPDGMNWNLYVEAETPEDAEREARLVLAHDRYHYAVDMAADGRVTRDRDWVVTEINLAESSA